MKLSRTVTYALHAILLLRDSVGPGATACSELARLGDMPERFLLQVLRGLVTHGLLISTRGVTGGYSLARPFESFSLLDLVEAVEGPVAYVVTPCEFLSAESAAKCDKALHDSHQHYRNAFSSLKLSQLSLKSELHANLKN